MHITKHFIIAASALLAASQVGATPLAPLPRPAPMTTLDQLNGMLVAGKRSCKAVSSCEEAVQMWCDGYRRADGDGDGIPCENVCSSKAEVDEIRSRIGC